MKTGIYINPTLYVDGEFVVEKKNEDAFVKKFCKAFDVALLNFEETLNTIGFSAHEDEEGLHILKTAAIDKDKKALNKFAEVIMPYANEKTVTFLWDNNGTKYKWTFTKDGFDEECLTKSDKKELKASKEN